MPDIVDSLHEHMDDPDIQELFNQSVRDAFLARFPDADITIHSTEEPEAVHVTVTPQPQPLTFTMKVSDEWEDRDDLRFSFVSDDDPSDTVEVDIAD